MTRRIARLSLVLTCALLLIGGGLSAPSAQAAGDITIEVGAQAGLRALLVVTIPVRVTCPSGVGTPALGGDEGVVVEQAAGAAIAHASSKSPVESDQPFVCDGTPHSNSITLLADPAGPPFHPGHAALRIKLNLCDADFANCVSGDSRIQVVQLRG